MKSTKNQTPILLRALEKFKTPAVLMTPIDHTGSRLQKTKKVKGKRYPVVWCMAVTRHRLLQNKWIVPLDEIDLPAVYQITEKGKTVLG
jgi:hypothetical protein